MKRPAPALVLIALATVSVSLGTVCERRVGQWSRRNQSDSVLKVLLGDGRRLFANHFFVMADVYFHSGYYPSVFDRRTGAEVDRRHLSGQEQEGEDGHDHEKEMSFLGRPKDWIESFGRHFMITEHTHLSGGGEREILPWLKLSAELDPQQVDTYTVAAFWLRNHLGKVQEAEQFLREGLRANPDSDQILFALGQLYYENYQDVDRARNVWELALRRWHEAESRNGKPEPFSREQITINLARLEEKAGNYQRAIAHLQEARLLSPAPAALDRQIDELRQKLRARPEAAQGK